MQGASLLGLGVGEFKRRIFQDLPSRHGRVFPPLTSLSPLHRTGRFGFPSRSSARTCECKRVSCLSARPTFPPHPASSSPCLPSTLERERSNERGQQRRRRTRTGWAKNQPRGGGPAGPPPVGSHFLSQLSFYPSLSKENGTGIVPGHFLCLA